MKFQGSIPKEIRTITFSSSQNQLALSVSSSLRMENLEKNTIFFTEPNDTVLYATDNLGKMNTKKKIELLQNVRTPNTDAAFPPQGKLS
ncbi:hypothetical protein NPIL_667691 [Nephila pilipes]|uniref:Uncharacterized protein n=1 Tax=Nephila pilipes TaxID=299642 RepID=A0A8X6Q2H0_NEPPI|nr:hypothetical protein NPIL_667691 [Nephila pilipes]